MQAMYLPSNCLAEGQIAGVWGVVSEILIKSVLCRVLDEIGSREGVFAVKEAKVPGSWSARAAIARIRDGATRQAAESRTVSPFLSSANGPVCGTAHEGRA